MIHMMDFDTFFSSYKSSTQSWHTSNFESANKKAILHQGRCVFPDVILVSNYHSYKKKTIKLLPYHSCYGAHIPPQQQLFHLFWQSISKKYKATRITIEQHSPKKFQTSSAMKSATFHIKHVWLLLLLCKI